MLEGGVGEVAVDAGVQFDEGPVVAPGLEVVEVDVG